MTELEKEVNQTFNIAVYLKLMSSFLPQISFEQVDKMVLDIYEFFKSAEEKDILTRLPQIKLNLEKMSRPILEKFPLKKSIDEITADFDSFFTNKYEIYSYGLEYGWLENRMCVDNLKLYDYVPYHFRIGLNVNKGNFGVEEEFLIKDSFNTLVKAQKSFDQLKKYGEVKKKAFGKLGEKNFDQETIKKLNDLKYEISANSRLAIISFYAFVECFVNSLGYSHARRNQKTLPENDFEILNGKLNGRFLNLKSKIERYHKLIRNDGKTTIITSDEKQIKEPFVSFFNIYENLRNSAVHFSPTKEQIWLKPADWVEKAEHFSKLSLQVALEIWKSCYPNIPFPDYIGRLDYNTFIIKANLYIQNLDDIDNEIKSLDM